MASLQRGESSSAANPILDLETTIGDPAVATDVETLEFRILDISTPALKGSPLQVYPSGSPGTFQSVDPSQADPDGVRLSVGHYFAPYEVPTNANIGDHRIEWQFKLNALAPYELVSEEFFVYESTLPSENLYCGVAEIRAEGFTESVVSDERILILSHLATRYIDKVTQRWFGARTFDENSPFILDGNDSHSLHLQIPIIRLDKLSIETQGLYNPDLIEIDSNDYRVYNRHMNGMERPDDRENPKIEFLRRRINQTVTSGLYPAPRIFPRGSQNIYLEGVFGYTDRDGSPFGQIPKLIQLAARRLVIRDLYLDSDLCNQMNIKNKFRIISDKEGSTTVKLQDLWLKGGFTGDSEIDNILTMYRAPMRIGIA